MDVLHVLNVVLVIFNPNEKLLLQQA
jgi:hypothetical protein